MANLSKSLNQGFAAPSIVANYGPYASIEAAHAALADDGLNVIGMTVGVTVDDNTIVEYWYQGGTALSNLVPKKPDLAAVATSGSYNDLTDKPTIPAPVDVSGKADKSEMSVTPGTGADADKTTIQLKSGTSATVLTQHQDISGKANTSDVNTALAGKANTADVNAALNEKANITDMNAALAEKADLDDVYTKSETYSKTEINGLVSTPHQDYETYDALSTTTSAEEVLPAIRTAEADTIYRVANWDGSANNGAGGYDVTKYSEYATNGTVYVFLSVKSAIGEVFDISEYNNSATYADLAAALGTNGANVPANVRQGGMSVKFVNSTSGKYEQWRYMDTSTANTDFVNINNWQGSETTGDIEVLGFNYTEGLGYVNSSGTITSTASMNYKLTPLYPCKEGEKFYYKGKGQNSAVSVLFYNGNTVSSYLSLFSVSSFTEVTVPSGVDGVKFASFDAGGTVGSCVLDVRNEKFYATQKYVDENLSAAVTPISDKLTALEGNIIHSAQWLEIEEGVGFVTSSGTISENLNMHYKKTQKVPCKEGLVFLYKGKAQNAAKAVIFYTDDTVIGSQNISSLDDYTEVTIPANANYVMFASADILAEDIVLDVRSNIIPLTSEQVSEMIENEINSQPKSSDFFNGKKYVAYGDSITMSVYQGGLNNPNVYPKLIANEFGLVLTNKGHSSTGPTTNLTDDNLAAVDADTMLVTISGGQNGWITSEDINTLDRTNCIGAINYYIDQIRQISPKCVIVLCPTFISIGDSSHYLQDYKRIAENKGVGLAPTCDLTLINWVYDTNVHILRPDDVHPSVYGARRFAAVCVNYIKNMIL